MGILGTSSSLATDIEKATSDVNTQEKWGLIMDVCDKVVNGAANSKECLKIIVKRLNHTDPHVVMQAITLLDACVSNCGKQFHLEVASREFETEFRKLLQKSQPKVNMRLKLCLKKWAEADFKIDPQLNLIPSLYQKLRSEGHDFNDTSVTPKREPQLSKDPNVVSSQQEEEDIAKAIELSLKESKSGGGAAGSSGQSPKMSSSNSGGSGSLYPTAMLAASGPVAEPRKVRALYDFEAAEDNELTFQAGEIIMVLDDSDPNWWKGQNQRGEGLFPSNFVTSDLNAEPEEAGAVGGKSKKSVQFSDEQKKEDEKAGAEGGKDQTVEINEEKIDRLLHLLHEADPEDPSADSEEMLQLEQMVNQMGPLIDTELERVDRKHAQLTQLSSDLVDAINLYHTLMREPDRSMMMGMGSAGYGMPGFPGQAPMPGMYGMPGMFNANMPPGMYAGMGGMPSGLPPYGMPHLRHDMGQMGLSGGPSSLPPQAQQQIPVSGAPLGMQGHPQMAPPQQHMPNMSIPSQLPPGPPQQQPQPSTSAPPPVAPQQQHPMMNLGHMQSPLPQSYSNPLSPPPIVSSVPTTLPNQQQPQQPAPVRLPQTQQPQVPQTISQPGGAFQPYASPPAAAVHQQAQPPNGHPATAPPPNHHPHPGQMAPPQYQTGPLQQPAPYMPQMGSGFAPNHHMLGHMMPPGTPLSINTATSSPQNIPIYQQQRTEENPAAKPHHHHRHVGGE